MTSTQFTRLVNSNQTSRNILYAQLPCIRLKKLNYRLNCRIPGPISDDSDTEHEKRRMKQFGEVAERVAGIARRELSRTTKLSCGLK